MRITRNRTLLLLVYAILSVLALSLIQLNSVYAQSEAVPSEIGTLRKFNVLFIAVDDLRPELACYGVSFMQTPNLDRLASHGMLFERAYCQVSVCNPSRASLLSGARPETTRVWDNQHFLRQFLPDVLTLPQYFKNHGWQTISLGKIFHNSDREPGQDPISWSELAWFKGKTGREWFSKETNDELNRLRNLPEKDRPALIRGPPFESANEPDDAYPDGQTALKAIETLQRLKKSESRFFLAVGFVKPHLTFSCPQKYWDLYPANSIRLPSNDSPPKDAPRPATLDPYELRSYGGVPAGNVSNALAMDLIRGYRSCVSFVDAQIGRVIDELDRLGLRDDTIVIVWGDHGYHIGENGVFTKMTNFERGTRVPLILSVPKQKSAGQKTRALVELVDVYPTLVELAGLPLPSHLEGASLVPLLEDPARSWKTAAFSEYARRGSATAMGRGPDTFMGHSIRTDRWRYTEWLDPKKEEAGRELYDHENDPAESVNLAVDPAYNSVVSDLAGQLRAGWKAAKPRATESP
ncbi:MAG: sulfatase [Pirellulaceae bacterium]|nr:sulfatase [Pirellulaceae bacterium]